MNRITEKVKQARSLYRAHLWQGRLVLAIMITVLVLVVVRVSLPFTIVHSSIYWLGKQGITAHIEDISIDVMNGTFTLLDASGSRGGETVFEIGRASIDWKWRPLAAKTIHIRGVELEGFDLIAEKHADAVVIAGVTIRPDTAVEPVNVEDEDSIDWATSLNQIDFSDTGFCFRQYDTSIDHAKQENILIDYCGNLDRFTWNGEFSLGAAAAEAQPQDSAIFADGSLNLKLLKLYNNKLDGALTVIGGLSLSSLRINGIDDIRLKNLAVTELSLLQNSGHPDHDHAVEFKKLVLGDITVSNTDTVAIATISLNKPVISMAMDESGRFKYEQWLLPQVSTSTEEDQSTPRPAGAAVFNIKLAGIDVTDTELCYQETAAGTGISSQALDYCLKLERSQWNGDIAVTLPSGDKPLTLQMNGNLALSGLVTNNKLLNRDLLSFDRLSFNDIVVTNPADLSLGRVELNDLNGLELISSEDRHTITLAGLVLSSLSYRDNALAVDSIVLNDLGADVTRNREGTLELVQWNPMPVDEQASKPPEADPSENEPVKISIGDFKLDSSRLIQFTDLGVEPPMKMGFNELQFNIRQLDSEQPGQQSPLTLHAKTTRHGTIDIKGVVMPFETKPSFDARGRVAGLDLRVVSPRVEQAVGHIIKSGQLDADLVLLSKAGQLDSKISLVLHHFKLKARSKQDAAALDETFGMPINQSLVLLKDKKGRIKLDIPITGDINNPDFDPTDAIIKATAKATTVTLITFYTPYGLAFAGGNILFDLATAMNFDPVVFDSGSDTLGAAHQQQLDKLTELLVERPGVHLTLCGFTNLKDREQLFTGIKDKDKVKPVTAEQLEKLKQLGGSRQDTIKNHLVTVGKIAHDRLILCAPEHRDDVESLSGVDISI